jgi:hypothetical protein
LDCDTGKADIHKTARRFEREFESGLDYNVIPALM